MSHLHQLRYHAVGRTVNSKKKHALLDKYDIAILSALATNTRLSTVELAAIVHLSRTAVSRRISALKNANVLKDAAPILNYSALGFTVHARVDIYAPSQSAEQLRSQLLVRPEVLTVLVIAGDGLLCVEVIALDMDHLHSFVKSLQRSGETKTKIVFAEAKSQLTLVERMHLLQDKEDSSLVRV